MVEGANRSRKRGTNAVSILCGLAVAVGAGAFGCSNDAATNTVRFELDFGSGVTLSSVDYVLTGPTAGFRRTGSLPVGDQPIVTATFQNLPPGQGYNMQVRGTASDDASGCRGEVTFNVTPSMTTMLQIPLTCTGLVAITTTFNSCPVIDGLSANPAEVGVGGSIELTVEAHDDDGGPNPLSVHWRATGGALSNQSTTGATFTCTSPGIFTVGVRISDGDQTTLCPETSTLMLACGDPV